jgi:hypothetical protein
MKKKTVRCVGTDRQGLQCGHRVYSNVRPALCYLHKPDAQPVGVVAQQSTDDPVEILKRLTKDKDPAIRLRAVTEWFDYQRKHERGCPVCAKRSDEDDERENMLARATLADREGLSDLIRQANALTSRIKTQPLVVLDDLKDEFDQLHPTPVTYIAPTEAPEELSREDETDQVEAADEDEDHHPEDDEEWTGD